jgi:type I restriction enzyme S subunit
MSEWKPAKLGDIADMCLGKMLDKEKNKGVLQPYLANLNVRWGGFELSNLSTMRFEESESERYGLRSGDLVICEGGEPGRCAIWRDEVPEMKIQKAIHRLRTNKNYSNEFVYYQFLLAGRNGELAKHFNGSTIKHLTGYSLKQVEFKFPPLAEQNRIAAVLSALDAKIALNHRINVELEGMAKLLYDYWFVQYDFPLSAAQAAALGQPRLTGQPYRSSGGPMVFDPQLKREIPVIWSADNLLQLSELGGGGTPNTKNQEYWSGHIPFFTPTDAEPQPFKLTTEQKITLKGLENSSTKVYPKGTLFVTARGSVGKIMIIASDMAMNQSCYALCPHEGVNTPFLYFHALSLVNFLRTKSSGSIFKSIVTNDIKFSTTVIPDLETIESFGKIAEPLFSQILNNQQQNQELTTLRDWLLPMLMNGQVRVG